MTAVKRTLFLSMPLALLAALTQPVRAAGPDEEAVRQLILQTYDRPETRLVVEPIVVEEDAAIADWVQGDMGGRAFLRRKDGKWSIELCAGDALKDVGALKKLGLGEPVAQKLSARLAESERGLAPSALALFSRFDDLVAAEAASGAPADPHHRPLR